MAIIEVVQPQLAWARPNTSSQIVGTVASGRYEVLRERRVGDVEFVRVRAEGLSTRAGWILLPKASHTTPPAPAPIRPAPSSIQPAPSSIQPAPSPIQPAPAPRVRHLPESILIQNLHLFRGYTYNNKAPDYPRAIPGVITPKGRTQNDCCTFVEGLLVPSFADALGPDFAWSRLQHQIAMIQTLRDGTVPLFGPVDVWVDAGLATLQADTTQLPEPWTVAQLWRKGGHTLLILDSDPASQRVLTLESNRAYGQDGPGFRGLGDLEDFADMHPGRRWHADARTWTWDRFIQSYPKMRLARLAVSDISWVRGGPEHGTWIGPSSEGVAIDDGIYVWDSEGGEYHALHCPLGYDIPAPRLMEGPAPEGRPRHDCPTPD